MIPNHGHSFCIVKGNLHGSMPLSCAEDVVRGTPAIEMSGDGSKQFHIINKVSLGKNMMLRHVFRSNQNPFAQAFAILVPFFVVLLPLQTA
jgi:hypothetical protein